MYTALICPFSTGPSRGNITTVQRIAQHLPDAGCQTAVIPLDSLTPQAQHTRLITAKPDILHSFHAFYAGPSARYHAKQLGIPYLVTITGSDLFHAQMRSDPSTALAVADASAITCFDGLVAEQFSAYFPDAAGKTAVIPQGVAPLPLHEKSCLDGSDTTEDHDTFTILFPAAIRPAKGILEAITALTPLADLLPNLRLELAGGELEPAYAEKVRQQARTIPWITLLGDVPHARMGALYATADLVLNCSLFEGGMANVLLEAMAMGRPVLARDITGNRSLIQHGETGWLYTNDEELRNAVLMAAARPEQRAAVGRAAKDFVVRHFSPEREAAALVALYQKLL